MKNKRAKITLKLSFFFILLKKSRGKRPKTYTKKDLCEALEQIHNGILNTRRASILFNIPRRTLRDYLTREKNAKNKEIKERKEMLESSGIEVEEINFKFKSNRALMFNRIKEYNETLSNTFK